MTDAKYQNHQHYIDEGWTAEPKETFKELLKIIERQAPDSKAVLDVGCATGELLGFLSNRLRGERFVGVDVSDDLLQVAQEKLPHADFVNASALSLPGGFASTFDLTCAIGCMSIFDETQIRAFWKSLLDATTPRGLVVVLSPLNEFGVDAMIRHRKRPSGSVGSWETGWNIFSQETIREVVEGLGGSLQFQRFEISIDLAPKPDPIRTWTISANGRQRQLTNGLKLLVDHYFMIARPNRRP